MGTNIIHPGIERKEAGKIRGSPFSKLCLRGGIVSIQSKINIYTYVPQVNMHVNASEFDTGLMGKKIFAE